jgi:hypothetical protein
MRTAATLALFAVLARGTILWGVQDKATMATTLSQVRRGASVQVVTMAAAAALNHTALTAIRNSGSIPYITVEPRDPNATDDRAWSLSSILDRRHDSVFTKLADAVAYFRHPVFLNFAAEMNEGQHAWSIGVNGNTAEEYRKAYQYVHSIFTSRAASNIDWVWCPSATGDPDLADFYPGYSYVDWTCLTGYNVVSHTWSSFFRVFQTPYKTIVQGFAPEKPLVAVTASAEGASTSDKSGWVSSTLVNEVPYYCNLKLLIWMNDPVSAAPAADVRIQSSSQSVDAFATAINGGYYTANWYASINDIPVPH